MKAFMTADAELDAEERAAIALEKTRADFKDVKPKEETFAGDVLEKAQKEATKSPSEVDGFDYHEFKLNHHGDQLLKIHVFKRIWNQLLKQIACNVKHN